MTTPTDGPGDAAPARPALRIVRGEPSDVEVAALVAVLAARAGATTQQPAPRRRSAWSDPTAAHRRGVAVGPGAWVWSGRGAGVRTRATP